MSNNWPTEQEALRTALGPGMDCPPIEDLERLTSEQPPAPNVARHLESCSYCRTELEMLHAFQAAEAGPASKEVERVSELLRARSKTILSQPRLTEARAPWWRAAFNPRRLAQASFAMAAVLVAAVVMIQFRPTKDRPLPDTTQSGQEVLRSGGFAVLSPVGDVQEHPGEIRWEKVANAVNYRVRVLEVDASELWKAETAAEHIDLPPAIRARIVPAKTLFCEVTAFDASGSKIGETGRVRFRLLQKSDSR
jgi:hypothetical protein